MESLMDMVRSAIDDRVVEQAAGRLGTSKQGAGNAIEAALPLLLGALGRNAANPAGANALRGALERDHAERDPASVLSTVLGGDTLDGEKILGHIFGERQQRAGLGVSKAAGIDGQSATQLLAMLAPVVMSVLGNRTRQGGLDASALGGLLGQERQRVEQEPGAGGLMNAVLDRDGDGDVDFADLAKNVGLLGGLFGKR